MLLRGDRFAEKMTRHIRILADESPAIRAIYFRDDEREISVLDSKLDLYLEQKNTVAKGLICKYPGRALFLLSYTCAANCRYCERQDRVGMGLDKFGRLSSDEILDAVSHLSNRTDITEVIFSGGDPLTNMSGLKLASNELAKVPHVKVLRIHTRFPLQSPNGVDLRAMESIVNAKDSYYLSLHVDHPDELTQEARDVIRSLRKMGYILASQSVFLRGVNDSTDVLMQLFSELFEIGVRPYYIYHCAPIPTTPHFVVPLEKEVEIMSDLRQKLSGLAVPQHILEMQNTNGKVVVPSDHWTVQMDAVRDFYGNSVPLSLYGATASGQ